MVTAAQQKQIISDLDTIHNVQDVYFHKNKLYVINSYDLPEVEQYLMETDIGADVDFVYTTQEEHSFG